MNNQGVKKRKVVRETIVHANEAMNITMQKQKSRNIQTGRAMDSVRKLKMLSWSGYCPGLLTISDHDSVPRQYSGLIIFLCHFAYFEWTTEQKIFSSAGGGTLKLSLSLIVPVFCRSETWRNYQDIPTDRYCKYFSGKWEQKLQAKRKNRADQWLEGDAHLNEGSDGTRDVSVSGRVHQGRERRMEERRITSMQAVYIEEGRNGEKKSWRISWRLFILLGYLLCSPRLSPHKIACTWCKSCSLR
jgi:hypothetical protein